MGFYACIYIEKINGDVNQPTDQKGECSAICLFESKKIEKRQRFAFSHTIVLIVSGQRRQTESFLSPTELSSSLSQLPQPFWASLYIQSVNWFTCFANLKANIV